MSTNSPRLILVKHAQPKIVPAWPASQWCLSEHGREQSRVLAARLAEYGPCAIVTSTECKSIETGQIVAEHMGLPYTIGEGLGEHDRSNEDHFDTVEQFESRVANFFAHPAERVYGRESADTAHTRFRSAVLAQMEQHPDEDLVIFTHGTVLTLFVTRIAKLDPYPFWRSLHLPAYVVLSRTPLRVKEIVERLDTETV